MTIIEAYGITYSAGDVKVNLLGRTLVGIAKIKYGSTQKKVNEKGMSRDPLSRKRGDRDYSCSLTLKSWEMDALERSAVPQNDDQNVGDICNYAPFPIVVAYCEPQTGGLIKTDIIRYCEFTGNTREIKGGDDTIEIECELIVGGIDRNI
jgi:hypothetical protein